MSLTFREIISQLGIDAPVHYTPRNQLNKANYIFFRYLGNEEADAIRCGTHSLEHHYDDSDIGLHFPDIEVSEYFELENKRNPVAIRLSINEISFQMPVSVDEIPIVYSVYCVLHEYGHWIHFLESGKTPYQYSDLEREARLPYEKTAREIYNMPDLDPHKIYLAERFEKEIYSQFPSEKAANQYAMDHIAEALTKIRNFQSKTS